MKLLKRFRNAWNGVKTKSVAFMASNLRFSGIEDIYDALNLRTFKESLYLFIGVSMIRESVSSIPLELYKIKNKDGDVEEVHESPVLDLFERPNYRQTQREFWQLAVAYYLLAGETFWYLEKETNNAEGLPTAMANMRPDHVEILFSEDRKEVIAYEFRQATGISIKIPAQSVLHIKNIDPTNPARGVGVIAPATQRILTEKEASKYQANTFKNQGRPDIAVFTDTDITSEASEEAREDWNKIYGEGGGGAGFFGSDVKSMQLLNVSPKEMGYVETQKFLRDDILAALHIPKAMITSDDVNLANAQTARIIYQKEAVMPVLDAFIDIINNKFLNDLEEDVFFTYESPVNEDRELVLKEAIELKKAEIITINEARALMNYPEVEDGDIRESGSGAGSMFQLSMKHARLSKLAKKHLKKRPNLYRKFTAVDAVAKLIRVQKEVKRERNSVFNTPELKDKYIKTFNDDIDHKALSFKDHVDIYNNSLLQRILKNQEDLGTNSQSIFDFATEMREAKAIFVPLMKKIFEKAGQATLDGVASGFSTKAAEQFYTPEALAMALELRAEFFLTSMLDTDYKHLQSIILEGMKEGLGVAEIGRKMRDYFDDMSVARAKTIARTETGRLISSATNEAYSQSAVVTGKEWLTARDAKVRNGDAPNNHVSNDGIIVDTRGVFPNGEQYPGELTINCRCAIAPAV